MLLVKSFNVLFKKMFLRNADRIQSVIKYLRNKPRDKKKMKVLRSERLIFRNAMKRTLQSSLLEIELTSKKQSLCGEELPITLTFVNWPH